MAQALSTARATSLALLRVYASVLFSRSPAVGALVLCATMLDPRAGALGLVGAAAANGVALLLGFEDEAVEEGAYGFNALLLGLGVGHVVAGDGPAIVAAVLGAAGCVILSAAWRATIGATYHLPHLSAPFIAAFALLSAAAPVAGAPAAHVAADPWAGVLPAGVELFVRSFGALFFSPRVDVGALVLLGLVVHSRIAAVLAVAAFAVALSLATAPISVPATSLLGLGVNAVLVALGLGAVWFVPSPHAFALAMLGAALSTAAFVGLSAPLARLGVPLVIIPFQLTILSVLVAMRRRALDEAPRSVDFLPGTPEENLAHDRTNRARFGALHPISFRLPFWGTWTCTQGVDGKFTHKGQWRHAFDFQVVDEEGRAYRGDAPRAADFHCYGLPVLAAAAGTVVAVEAGVPDSAVGEVNVERNWGNYVVVHHAPGLYSLVGHLSPGTVKVAIGQVVAAGDVLGLAGSSGRSPEPHLHFQLQTSAELGAPTLPCRFASVVTRVGDELRFDRAVVPREGDALRNVNPDDEVVAYLPFTQGQEMSFRVGGAVERVVTEVDVLGRFLVRSLDRPATLFYARTPTSFTALDAVGDPASVVALLLAALPSLPFEAQAAIAWTDTLPSRRFRSPPMRVLGDLVAQFHGGGGMPVELSLRREGHALVVRGESRSREGGPPLLRTRAVLGRGLGPVRIEVTIRGRTVVAERIITGAPAGPEPPAQASRAAALQRPESPS